MHTVMGRQLIMIFHIFMKMMRPQYHIIMTLELLSRELVVSLERFTSLKSFPYQFTGISHIVRMALLQFHLA